MKIVSKNVILGGLMSYAALEVLARLYLYYSRKKKETEIINEVFFFSDKSVSCSVEHSSNSSPCKNPSCAYSVIGTIINCIEKTTESLEVCIYIVTYFDLADAILKAHRKGKRVRVIADADTSECSQSQIKHLRQGGIPVRMKKSPYIMHHKFFIVDDNILMTGSFNWTMQAMTDLDVLYKRAYTVKSLIAVTPSGMISLWSVMGAGRVTFITNDSGLLNLREPGNEVMTDKVFSGIKTSLPVRGVVVVTPPFLCKGKVTVDETKTA